jgi:hypothetical protein
MLSTWPELSPALVQVASLATRLKIMAGALSELSMAVLTVLWLERRIADAAGPRERSAGS